MEPRRGAGAASLARLFLCDAVALLANAAFRCTLPEKLGLPALGVFGSCAPPERGGLGGGRFAPSLFQLGRLRAAALWPGLVPDASGSPGAGVCRC